jgi:hypothetical protein
MAKTVEFTVKNSKPFTSYLRKFASIDSTVLFEADLENSRFIGKAPNEERSLVKQGIISFEDAGFELKTKQKIRIKIGIYSIGRLIKIMEQFGTEFDVIIKYDEVLGKDNQKDFAAISIILSNNDLKFNIECTSLNIFKYITDDLYNNQIRKFAEVISFEFSKELIEKVRTLCELDKDYKLLEFNNKGGQLYAKGKAFEYLLVPTSNVDIKIPFYKEQFDKVDVENCKVSIGVDRILFSSNDTSTEIIVSKVEVNDNYEEVNEDPFK